MSETVSARFSAKMNGEEFEAFKKAFVEDVCDVDEETGELDYCGERVDFGHDGETVWITGDNDEGALGDTIPDGNSMIPKIADALVKCDIDAVFTVETEDGFGGLGECGTISRKGFKSLDLDAVAEVERSKLEAERAESAAPKM